MLIFQEEEEGPSHALYSSKEESSEGSRENRGDASQSLSNSPQPNPNEKRKMRNESRTSKNDRVPLARLNTPLLSLRIDRLSHAATCNDGWKRERAIRTIEMTSGVTVAKL